MNDAITLAIMALRNASARKEMEVAETLGQLFAELPDDAQAHFFESAQKWLEKIGTSPLSAGLQWYFVGKRVKGLGMQSPAAVALASMAAPLYAATLQYCDTVWSDEHRVEIL